MRPNWRLFPTYFHWLAILLLLPVVSLLSVQNVRGEPAAPFGSTITVTTIVDELTDDGNCSLREAIRAANLDTPVDACPAGSGPDLIVLADATYYLAIAGQNDDDGLTGDLDMNSNISILGAGSGETIVDGQNLDRVFHIRDSASVTLTKMTIQHGQISTGGLYGGGGILNQSSQLVVTDSRITDNTAVNNPGGGLDNNGGTVSLLRVSMSNNTAPSGGGIYNGGNLLLVGSTLSINSSISAGSTGGGLDNSGIASLTNVTIQGNTAQNGGGIFNDGTITSLNITVAYNNTGIANSSGEIRFKNSIVSDSSDGPNCSGGGTNSSEGNNLDSGNTCNFITTSDLHDTNPNLGALLDNGGPTLTIALMTGSPAIDSGNNLDCPLKDQRGAFRPADGDSNGSKICDIGAYEYAGTFPVFIYLPVVKR
jgi:CSLREA domain-containing protein